MKIFLSARSRGAALALLCLLPLNATQAEEAVKPSPLSATELVAEAPLSAKVSFEVKRMPLAELVALLQKQSGVTLALAEDAAKMQARVTARVQKMSLASVLGAFQRMYGVRWSRAANGYTMHASDRGELHLKMLQTGEPLYYRFRYRRTPSYYEQIEREAELAGEVLENLDFEQLKTPQGVPFSDLPPDLQQRVRDRVLEKQAERVMEAQQLLEIAARRELYLRFGTEEMEIVKKTPRPVFAYKAPRLFGSSRNTQTMGRAGLMVETDTGALVTGIFPGFAALPPDMVAELPPNLSFDEAARISAAVAAGGTIVVSKSPAVPQGALPAPHTVQDAPPGFPAGTIIVQPALPKPK